MPLSALLSFPPIIGPDATRLILGSMPGAASLQACQYYAHPRNAFWTITETLLGIPRTQPYPDRVRSLQDAGVAVWDVLRSCRRTGSLDSAIETDSVEVNDFHRLFVNNPQIKRIYFNGGTASRLFERHVLKTLSAEQQQIPRWTLPSTSPAHAGRSLAQKTKAWQIVAPR